MNVLPGWKFCVQSYLDTDLNLKTFKNLKTFSKNLGFFPALGHGYSVHSIGYASATALCSLWMTWWLGYGACLSLSYCQCCLSSAGSGTAATAAPKPALLGFDDFDRLNMGSSLICSHVMLGCVRSRST